MCKRVKLAAVVLAVAIVACAGDERPVGGMRADTAAVGDMAGMPGMDHGNVQDAAAGAMASQRMMAEMRADLRQLPGAGSDSLRRMLPRHRQMAANLLALITTEMRQMGMTGDAGWTALTDSIRQDLILMPDVGVGELPAFMEGHGARLERLMVRHDAMQ